MVLSSLMETGRLYVMPVTVFFKEAYGMVCWRKPDQESITSSSSPNIYHLDRCFHLPVGRKGRLVCQNNSSWKGIT